MRAANTVLRTKLIESNDTLASIHSLCIANIRLAEFLLASLRHAAPRRAARLGQLAYRICLRFAWLDIYWYLQLCNALLLPATNFHWSSLFLRCAFVTDRRVEDDWNDVALWILLFVLRACAFRRVFFVRGSVKLNFWRKSSVIFLLLALIEIVP